MFRHTFATLFGLACETRLLEACEWDEERAEELSDIFSHELSVSTISAGDKTKEQLIDELRESLLRSAKENEVNTLIDILNECSENPFLLFDESELDDN